jgi:hypothetical protein
MVNTDVCIYSIHLINQQPFVRIKRTYGVNPNNITEVGQNHEPWEIGQRVKIGRSYGNIHDIRWVNGESRSIIALDNCYIADPH